MSGQRDVALLTGASSGLGRALASLLVARGWRVILVARRGEALNVIATQLGERAIPVPCDLTSEGAASTIEREISARGISLQELALLVNNAGSGTFGPFVEGDLTRYRTELRLNVGVLMDLTHWAARLFVEHGGGTIANVASVASFSAGPLMSVYYANKGWVATFGQSLDAELRPRGVRVVTVCPGPFASEFHARSGMRIEAVRGIPSAERVAGKVMRAIERRRVVAPIGVGAHVWAWFGPRLPLRLSRAIMLWLQRSRLPHE